jgi:ketosteroid isomerase-like protein
MDNNTHVMQQLPATISAFLQAQADRDADQGLGLLTEDAVLVDVADGGQEYRGEEGHRRFIAEAGTEFTYTTELTKAERDGEVWVVGHHLEGDFPGGQVDLDYRFTLDGDPCAPRRRPGLTGPAAPYQWTRPVGTRRTPRSQVERSASWLRCAVRSSWMPSTSRW